MAASIVVASSISLWQALGPIAEPPFAEGEPGEIRQVSSALGCIALTFDDGPDPVLTPLLLSILAEEDVVATFFVLGDHVAASPEIARAAVAAGHELGNHSWNHAHLPLLSDEEIRAEIDDTDQAVLSATGQLPAVFRLPYGESNETVRALIHRPIIRWDVDPLDWMDVSPAALAETVYGWARSGSIIILHDIFATTIDAVRPMVENLKDRGYQFVTVSRLLSGEPCLGAAAYDRMVAKNDAVAIPQPDVALATASKVANAAIAAR